MLMMDRSWTWANILRRGLRFAVERLYTPELMKPGESLAYQLSRDGLAVCLIFDSPHPEQMLDRISKIAFPSFAPQPFVRDGQFYRATFRVIPSCV